jgi:hypothetical protein
MFGKDIEISDNINKEINSSKVIVNQHLKLNNKIIDQITNLKDNQNNPISNIYEYEIKKKINVKRSIIG